MKKLLFEQLKKSLGEAGKIKQKRLVPGRTFKFDPRNGIVQARGRLGLSQAKFAQIVGVSVDTLQNWEQGRRTPSGPARVLMEIVATHPEVLMDCGREHAHMIGATGPGTTINRGSWMSGVGRKRRS